MGKNKISKEKRSHIMSCIRSKNTRIEILLRRALWHEGYRYRIHAKLPGHPDIIFSSKKLAVFVDGDFWHGYDWRKLRPKLKNAFWVNKIRTNMQRDKKVDMQLEHKGWHIIRFWEHELRNNLNGCLKIMEKAIKAYGKQESI